MGSIIKNLNVSINRHNNNMAQSANIHEPTANKMDDSIKQFFRHLYYNPKSYGKKLMGKNGESNKGYIWIDLSKIFLIPEFENTSNDVIVNTKKNTNPYLQFSGRTVSQQRHTNYTF